jgi:hypothetical protein
MHWNQNCNKYENKEPKNLIFEGTKTVSISFILIFFFLFIDIHRKRERLLKI